MVDWARAAGFEVVAAGKGTKYLPAYHASTPDTVWGHYGFTAEKVARGDFNAQMFNSFLDGTKIGDRDGGGRERDGTHAGAGRARVPAVRRRRSAARAAARADGGVLHHRGQVEVVSSLERDGSPVFRDLRWGVYVTFARRQRVRAPLLRANTGSSPTRAGEYAAMYKPFHLIGLELGICVASVGLRGEPTGAPTACAATSWRPPSAIWRAGETLDGEGGYTVYGRLMPAGGVAAHRRLADRARAQGEARQCGEGWTAGEVGRRGNR